MTNREWRYKGTGKPPESILFRSDGPLRNWNTKNARRVAKHVGIVQHCTILVPEAKFCTMDQVRMKAASLFLLFAISAVAQTYADLVLTNGKIWTVDEAQPRAEALACIGSRIVAIGS